MEEDSLAPRVGYGSYSYFRACWEHHHTEHDGRLDLSEALQRKHHHALEGVLEQGVEEIHALPFPSGPMNKEHCARTGPDEQVVSTSLRVPSKHRSQQHPESAISETFERIRLPQLLTMLSVLDV